MKKQASQKEVDQLFADCIKNGWTDKSEGNVRQVTSPMSKLGDWVIVSIVGRRIRTVVSYSRKEQPGLWNARYAEKWVNEQNKTFPLGN